MLRKRGVFLIVMVILLFLFSGCSDDFINDDIKVKEGCMDLEKVNFEEELVHLNGKWEFYWDELLSSSEITDKTTKEYIYVPSSWNKHTDNKSIKSGEGFATYRFTFNILKDQKLALKMPKIRTAYKLFINDEMIAFAGKVGKNMEEEVPRYVPQVAFFNAKEGKNEIIIQVSNFSQRSGGITDSIELGSEKQIMRLKHLALGRAVFLFGSLLTVAIYNLSFYIFRRKTKAFLYFGLLSVLLALRTFVVEESYFTYLFQNITWEFASKLKTLTFYLGGPLALMFLSEIYPKYIKKMAIKTAKIIAIIFSLLVILTKPRFFTYFNSLYQVLSILLVFYVIYELFRIAVNGEENSSLIIFGVLALVFAFINDIVYLSVWTNDLGFGNKVFGGMFNRGELSSYGQFIFATTNSILLAKRFSTLLKSEEKLSQELKEINKNLDRKVFERTKALEASKKLINNQNLSLEEQNEELRYLSSKDSLTGLINRREYDRMCEKKWNECIRDEKEFSLVFIDIDDFKLYNDTYGHMLGDVTLIKVANTIKDSFYHLTHAISRYGGEEFVVLITDTDIKEIMIATKHFLKEIQGLDIPNKNSPNWDCITSSIGITSIVPTKKDTYSNLFKTVDKAMYISKRKGKNTMTFLEHKRN